MKQITIAYIGGGSKNWAHKYFSDLLLQDKICGEIRLYDTDIPAAERNKIFFDKMVASHKRKIKSKWNCVVANDIDKALTGADFVLISILPYAMKHMYYDVHYAEKYGIYQSVGDTVGPGGYSRALRTIPTFVYFGQMIKKYCPEAWVINYTNPMSMCTNTLFYTFPEIKCFGCCHEVFSTQKLLAQVIKMYQMLSPSGQKAFMSADLDKVKAELASKGKFFANIGSFSGIDRHEIKVNVQAINHFTFINSASYNGIDLFPIYSAYIKMFRKQNNNIFGKGSVKFDLFEKYGLIACAGDRHLAEFIPYTYLTSPRGRRKYGFGMTTVNFRIFREFYQKLYVKMVSSLPFVPTMLKTSGEEGVLQIIGLCGIEPIVSNVNVLNKGQIPNLPMGTAVETNALFDGNGVTVHQAGELKPEVAELVAVHAENQMNFVKACMNHDRNGLIEAFLKDPAVARIPREKGIKLFEELVKCNRDCIEKWI